MDHRFAACAEAMIAVAKARNVSLRASLDLIPGSMLTYCWRSYAERPQTCVGGGFASGGSKLQSGSGTLRRIVDVEKFLADVAAYRDRKPREAA